MTDLKPCPFCGGDAGYSERECLNSDAALQYFEFISCDDCDCCISSEHTDDIYATWNTRTPQWNHDMEAAPRGNVRLLLLVPPYGSGSGNWDIDAERWNCHFCLNKEVQPIGWMHLPEGGD